MFKRISKIQRLNGGRAAQNLGIKPKTNKKKYFERSLSGFVKSKIL